MQVIDNQYVSPTKDLVGKPVEVRVLFRALPLNHQGVTAAPTAEVDGGSSLMNEAGDKMATNRGETLPKGRRKKACPFLKVKAGSAVVPIYRTACKGRLRYTLSFYRDGRRMRKINCQAYN